MSKITEFIKDNKSGTALITAGVVGIAVIAGCQGFSIRDNVKLDVPTSMQEAIDTEERVSVNEAEFVREDFVAWAGRVLGQFDRRYVNAEGRARVLESLLNTGLDAAGASLPAGGIGLLLLGSVGGLLTKGPGTAGREAGIGERAEQAGYQRAMREFVANQNASTKSDS